MALGFYLDQTLCTGCKACQIACKDKHDLPVGVTWRRVAEYSGGTWSTDRGAVTARVFTYYTSVACNHCDSPVCVQVCPTTAMTKRPDGTVYVDTDKCVGCRYCEWACPYGAPQFNAATGHMSKCDLCADYREGGQDPACVSACPSRALGWGEISDLRAAHPGAGAGVEPLPDPGLTMPNLVIVPHRDAQASGSGTGTLMNPEEL